MSFRAVAKHRGWHIALWGASASHLPAYRSLSEVRVPDRMMKRAPDQVAARGRQRADQGRAVREQPGAESGEHERGVGESARPEREVAAGEQERGEAERDRRVLVLEAP